MSRSGVPQVTRAILTLVVVLSILNAALKYATYADAAGSSLDRLHLHDIGNPYLTFDPSLSIFVQPWVVVTSSLIEENLVTFGITFGAIYLMGRYLEGLWTSRAFVQYVVMLNVVVTNLVTFTLYKLWYMSTLNPETTVHIGSSAGILMGLLVALKQRLPNHYLLVLGGYVRVQVSIVPFLSFLYLCFMALVVDRSYTVCTTLALVSFGLSWAYLRFVQENGLEHGTYLLPLSDHSADAFTQNMGKRNTLTGDRTDEFSLHTFFPYPLSVGVAWGSDCLFNQAVRCGLVTAEDFGTESPFTHAPQAFAEYRGRFVQTSLLNGMAGPMSPVSINKKLWVRLGERLGWRSGPLAESSRAKDRNQRHRAIARFGGAA